MTISMEEVYILIHESALEEIVARKNRVLRRIIALEDDLRGLEDARREKQAAISAARDIFLRRVV